MSDPTRGGWFAAELHQHLSPTPPPRSRTQITLDALGVGSDYHPARALRKAVGGGIQSLGEIPLVATPYGFKPLPKPISEMFAKAGRAVAGPTTTEADAGSYDAGRFVGPFALPYGRLNKAAESVLERVGARAAEPLVRAGAEAPRIEHLGTAPHGDQQLARYALPGGDEASVLFHQPNPEELRVAFMGSTGGEGSLGPSAIKDVLRQITESRPGVRRITGNRISGARAGREVSVPVPGRAPVPVLGSDPVKRSMAPNRRIPSFDETVRGESPIEAHSPLLPSGYQFHRSPPGAVAAGGSPFYVLDPTESRPIGWGDTPARALQRAIDNGLPLVNMRDVPLPGPRPGRPGMVLGSRQADVQAELGYDHGRTASAPVPGREARSVPTPAPADRAVLRRMVAEGQVQPHEVPPILKGEARLVPRAQKFNTDFLTKAFNAEDGAELGTVGDFLVGPKIRTLYKDVLDVPVRKLTAPPGGVPSGTTFHGGLGNYDGRPTIFFNGADQAGDGLATLLEEAAHGMRVVGRGRVDVPQMLGAGFDFGAYRQLPAEQSAARMVRHALALREDPLLAPAAVPR